MSKLVLHIRLEAPSYSSSAIQKGFEENEFDYIMLDWQRYRFTHGIEKLRSEILSLQNIFDPQYIFIHVQLEGIIDVPTAKNLSEKSFVINYTEDVREDTTWYEEVGKEIGLTVFTNYDDVEKLNSRGIPAAYLATSFNDQIYKPQAKTATDYGEIIFIGNNFVDTNMNFPEAITRYAMCKFLKDTYGDRFKIYGMNWSSLEPHARLLSPYEAVEAYNNCKISLSQSNYTRGGYSSDRLYNSVSSGALTLMEHYPGIEREFGHRTFGLHWETFEELKGLIDTYLSCPQAATLLSKQITDYVREKCTWTERIKELFFKIGLKEEFGERVEFKMI